MELNEARLTYVLSWIAVRAGATATSVARALGHASFAVTERHYADPSAVVNARSKRVQQAMAVGKAGERGPDLLDDLLAQLDPEERQALARRLLDGAV